MVESHASLHWSCKWSWFHVNTCNYYAHKWCWSVMMSLSEKSIRVTPAYREILNKCWEVCYSRTPSKYRIFLKLHNFLAIFYRDTTDFIFSLPHVRDSWNHNKNNKWIVATWLPVTGCFLDRSTFLSRFPTDTTNKSKFLFWCTNWLDRTKIIKRIVVTWSSVTCFLLDRSTLFSQRIFAKLGMK